LSDAVCFQTTNAQGGPTYPGASPACGNNTVITLTLPSTAPLLLYYHSQKHGFGGVIRVHAFDATKQLIITTPGNSFNYTVVGADATAYGQDPDIYLELNATYSLVINTNDDHPVVIQTASSPLGENLFPGALPMTWFNTGTFTLMTGTEPIILYFICEYHGFYGRFLIGQSPAPEDDHFVTFMLAVWLICGAGIIAVLVQGYRAQERSKALLDLEHGHHSAAAGKASGEPGKAYSVLPDDSKRADDKLSLNSDKK